MRKHEEIDTIILPALSSTYSCVNCKLQQSIRSGWNMCRGPWREASPLQLYYPRLISSTTPTHQHPRNASQTHHCKKREHGSDAVHTRNKTTSDNIKRTNKKKEISFLGCGESNPGLLRKQTLLGSESQRCYRYTTPDSRSNVVSDNLGYKHLPLFLLYTPFYTHGKKQQRDTTARCMHASDMHACMSHSHALYKIRGLLTFALVHCLVHFSAIGGIACIILSRLFP